MKNVTINLYSFEELNEKARQKAISEHQSFLDGQPEQYENEDGEMVEEYVEHTEADAIENIEANEYIYFEDGKLAHCCTYTGKHEKAGITEFYFHGSTFTL